jgi:hypothetical protein
MLRAGTRLRVRRNEPMRRDYGKIVHVSVRDEIQSVVRFVSVRMTLGIVDWCRFVHLSVPGTILGAAQEGGRAGHYNGCRGQVSALRSRREKISPVPSMPKALFDGCRVG